ncbi:hypothetical protein D3C72_1750180 [compost metagenome]
MGGVRERTHFGVTIIGRLNTRSRITSNAAEPGPMMMPALSSTVGTPASRNSSPQWRRELRWRLLQGIGCMAPR